MNGEVKKPLKTGGSMSIATSYSHWLEERGLIVPFFNPPREDVDHPISELKAQGIDVQYSGALEPKCLFILDAYDMEQWQSAFAFMLKISQALGLPPSDVGVFGVLTRLPAWPDSVNRPLKSLVEHLTSKHITQILCVGKRAHDLFQINKEFEEATVSPDTLSLGDREFRYLAIWDHRDMVNQPSLKKSAWLAMQQLLTH
jgi:hypothetical protein